MTNASEYHAQNNAAQAEYFLKFKVLQLDAEIRSLKSEIQEKDAEILRLRTLLKIVQPEVSHE